MSSTVLKAYQGSEEEVVVSFSEDGEAITQIGAKAFLSCKSIKKLEIAGSVTEIGDWAFAHMQNLQTLVLPRREIQFGKKVFLDCGKLTQIQIKGDESDNSGTSWFLASAVRSLKKEILCRPEEAADREGHKFWIQEYDNALFDFLEKEDKEGFDPVFFGWFRVEDIDEQIPRYLEKKRQEKAQLVLQRLLYPAYLCEENREKLYDYIRAHMPAENDKKEHTAVFDLFCDDTLVYGTDIRYLQILKDGGCLDDFTVKQFLEKMPNASAEVKAFLLREQLELKERTDYFEEFHF